MQPGKHKVNDYRDSDGRSPLHLAALHGYFGEARFLVEAGADLNAVDHAGRTPLHEAVRMERRRITMLLIESGAQVDIHDKKRQTPLSIAVSFRRGRIAEVLFEAGARANAVEPLHGGTVLHSFASRGEFRMLLAVLRGGADVNVVDERGSTPLHAAVGSEDVDCVQLLIASGARVNAANVEGVTPLLRALEKGNAELVELLLEHGADAGAVDEAGNTVSDWARFKSTAGCRQVLNRRCAMVAASSSWKKKPYVIPAEYEDAEASRRLVRAINVHDLEAIKRILAKWGDAAWRDATGTELHMRQFDSDPASLAVLRTLATNGCDINATNMMGDSPFHEACSCDIKGTEKIVALELDCGADINKRNRDGAPPILMAAKWGSPEVINVLLRRGADIHGTDKWGYTPLHGVLQFGRYRNLIPLLEHGARPDQPDARGWTPIERAEAEGQHLAADILRGG